MVKIGEIARRWKCSRRCAKRRLKAYHERILERTNGEWALLYRNNGSETKTHLWVDLAVAKRFLPSIGYDGGVDPVVEMRKEVQDVLEIVMETRDMILRVA